MANTSSNITADQYTEILIGELIKTEDFKRVTGSFIHELISKWAGESNIKKKIAPPIENKVKKLLFDDDLNGAATYGAKDSTALADPIIALTNDMLAKVENIGNSLDDLSYEKKEELLEKILSNVNFGALGALSGPLMRSISEVYEKNPSFLSGLLKDKLVEWVGSINFSSIEKYLSGTQDDLLEITKAMNDALWEDEDRLLSALDIIPAGINLLTKNMGEILGRFSKLKIDDLTDIFLHILEKLDGEALGTLFNAHAHINRKIMKGTEEFRDPDTEIPPSENIFMTKFEEIASKMDPNLIFNFRLKLEDLKVPLREWLMSD